MTRFQERTAAVVLVGAFVLAGCGGASGAGTLVSRSAQTQSPRGARVTYQAEGHATRAVLDKAVQVLRDRIARGPLKGHAHVSVTGRSIVVRLADVHSRRQALSLGQGLAAVGDLRFYDWETNVLGPGCEPDPTNPQVTGGSQAGNPIYGISQYKAVQRAAQCRARNPDTPTTNGTWYLLDTKKEKVVAGPAESRSNLFFPLQQKRPTADQKVVEVQPGTVIVRARAPVPTGSGSSPVKPDKWYVLNDTPALHGTDIKDPEQKLSNGTAGGQPIVTFKLTSKARKHWRHVTEQIARRGQDNHIPGADPVASAQHFAIVLDDDVISLPYIDYRAYPDGIDAAHGSQIRGGFTLDAARNLAALLGTGQLPVPLRVSHIQVWP